MINRRASIDFRERSQCLAVAFLIEGKVPLNRFLHDPASRALEAFCKTIEPTGELVWNVCCHDPISHGI